ncbi:putative beta-fructofuranosidase, insoluble isoenzyme CWINV3-like isoform X1 [Capsicum annuum]|nr:putative beta-fructofuranosidase, insoluble isoenzyme CWINV3-like isoform X1 [Capsicum annuum]
MEAMDKKLSEAKEDKEAAERKLSEAKMDMEEIIADKVKAKMIKKTGTSVVDTNKQKWYPYFLVVVAGNTSRQGIDESHHHRVEPQYFPAQILTNAMGNAVRQDRVGPLFCNIKRGLNANDGLDSSPIVRAVTSGFDMCALCEKNLLLENCSHSPYQDDNRIAEAARVVISFDSKPIPGDWNGAGACAHLNYRAIVMVLVLVLT